MRVIWRYNTIVLKHEEQHPQLKNTYALLKIPASMLLKSYISVKEEQAMGITPQATSEYRGGFGMMKCDYPALDAYQGSNPLLKPKKNHNIMCSK
jgi:hypothetical protein